MHIAQLSVSWLVSTQRFHIAAAAADKEMPLVESAIAFYTLCILLWYVDNVNANTNAKAKCRTW